MLEVTTIDNKVGCFHLGNQSYHDNQKYINNLL